MPRMTRSHYNLVADATHEIIQSAKEVFGEQSIQFRVFATKAASAMTEAVAGTNSQFKADRFKDRCLGIRKGP